MLVKIRQIFAWNIRQYSLNICRTFAERINSPNVVHKFYHLKEITAPLTLYICIYIHTYKYIYIYIYVYMCVCVYIYIYMMWNRLDGWVNTNLFRCKPKQVTLFWITLFTVQAQRLCWSWTRRFRTVTSSWSRTRTSRDSSPRFWAPTSPPPTSRTQPIRRKLEVSRKFWQIW